MAAIDSLSRDALRSAPLWPVAVGLLLGMALDDIWPRPGSAYIWWFVGSGVLLALGVTRRYPPALRMLNIATLWILIGAISSGGLLHERTSGRLAAGRLAGLLEDGTGLARMRGDVISEPRVFTPQSRYFSKWSFREPQTTFTLSVASWEGVGGWFDLPAIVRVNVLEPVLDLEIGDAVEVFARLGPLSGPRNPGGYGWSAAWRRKGITLRATCKVAENISRLGKPDSAPSSSVIGRLRRWVSAAMSDDLDNATDEQISLLEAMVLGQRSRVDRTLNDAFVKAGCVHFLTASGLHLAIPVSFAWWLGRRLQLRNRACCVLMVLAIVGYLIIAEPRPPIMRAAVMGFLYCGSRWSGRASAGINWLAAAVVVVAILQPEAALSAGFQFSFMAVAGIMLLSPALANALLSGRRVLERHVLRDPYAEADRNLVAFLARTDQGWRGLRWRIKQVLLTNGILLPLLISFAAWAAVAPLVALYFQKTHPLSPVVAVALVPLVYVVVLLTIAKIGVDLLLPGWGSLLSPYLLPVEQWLIALARWFGSLPAAQWHVAKPSPIWLVSYYLALLLFVYRFRPDCVRRSIPPPESDDGRRPPSATRSAYLIASLLLLAAATAASIRPARRADQLWVTALSVGAGSATVIELPNGETLIYDCGSTLIADTGRRPLVPYLRYRNRHRIDGVFVSHANLDHYNGIPSIFGEMDVGPTWLGPRFTGYATDRSATAHFLQTIRSLGARVEILDGTRRTWERGGVRFEWLWPIDGAPADLAANDASLVLRLTYAGRAILLTGDIEAPAQQALMASGSLGADVLWLPHHGSVERTTGAFIAAVSPAVCIRSSRQPMAQTANGIDRLVGDAAIYSTADVGAVQVGLTPGGLEIRTPCIGRGR